MNLRIENINRKNAGKVKEIYTSSFLKEDRMPFLLMLILSKLRSTKFLSFYNEDILCGFVYMATIKTLTFIMFFAVDETLRSQGYGSRILEKVQSIYPNNKIVVSIERCDEDSDDIKQRLRRKEFYTLNGYKEAGYLVKLAGKEQELLIKNGEFNKSEFIWFFLRYSNFTIKPKLLRKSV